MNNSSRDQPRGFKGRCKLSQANQATGGVNMFHTLGVRQWFAWGSHQCQTGAPRLETWVSFGSPINSSTQTHLFNLIQGSNTYSCTSNKHWLRILMFVLHDTWQKKSNPRTEELDSAYKIQGKNPHLCVCCNPIRGFTVIITLLNPFL